MPYVPPSVVIWGLLAILPAGLFSTWFARVTAGSEQQVSGQRVFLACLLLVGIATFIAFLSGARFALITSAVLSIMVIGVTCEFNTSRRKTA